MCDRKEPRITHSMDPLSDLLPPANTPLSGSIEPPPCAVRREVSSKT